MGSMGNGREPVLSRTGQVKSTSVVSCLLKKSAALALSLLLLSSAGLTPTLAFAESSSVGNSTRSSIWVMPQANDTSVYGMRFSSRVDNILSSLKQVSANNSTIQIKELMNFKGNLVVIPITSQTPRELLDALANETPTADSPYQVFVPIFNTQTAATILPQLQALGFDVSAAQSLPMSAPWTLSGSDSSLAMPIGSSVLKTQNTDNVVATWGDRYPAAIKGSNPKRLLLIWQWSKPFPGQQLAELVRHWQQEQPAVASNIAPVSSDSVSMPSVATSQPTVTAPKETPAVVKTASSDSGRRFGSSETASRARSKLSTDTRQARPKFHAKQAASKPAKTPQTQPTKLAVSPFRTPDAPVSPPEPKVESTTQTNMVIPASQPTNETPAASKPVGKEEESYPTTMYDFDGEEKAYKPDWSADTRNALADFYNDQMRNIHDLEDRANQLASKLSAYPDQVKAIQDLMEQAHDYKSTFDTAWFEQNYPVALDALDKSKSAYMSALMDQAPISHVEGRAIWLDRGSIVRAQNEAGLRQLIRRIAHSGFNVIYFETINAGFALYNSQIAEHNPELLGWDPLQVAVDEAHKNGVELHAWVWCFAVGNVRHNKLIGKPDSYPGPVLSRPEMMAESLRGPGGELVPSKQHEYWLSPASAKARQFLLSEYAEIVKNYPVDGLQLDYIRYPFQKPGEYFGYQGFESSRFKSETGLGLGSLDDYTLKAWSAWKAFQVTSFVKETSETLKKIRPNLKLSAAVFPLARYNRMKMIQQDWETWVRNGWIDTLNPMAYSRSARSLSRLVDYIHTIGEDHTLVYPGLSLSKLNAVELLDTLDVIRRMGVMGSAMFAYAQFNNDTEQVLRSGPYKENLIVAPHRNPLKASTVLADETKQLVDKLVRRSKKLPDMPGHETLESMQARLGAIQESLKDLNKNDTPASRSKKVGGMYTEAEMLLTTAKDESRLLNQDADLWVQQTETDMSADFQAKYLKLMVEKLVRLVNYSMFQDQMHAK